MEQVFTLISDFGFPIVVSCFTFYFIYLLWKQSKEREDKLIKIISSQNDKFDVQSKQLEIISLTQEKIVERLERIEYKEGIIDDEK